MNPQQFTMNPLQNTLSTLNVSQLKGMFESSHQTHKDSLGLFDKASSTASDKTKKKGPAYRGSRKDHQVRVSWYDLLHMYNLTINIMITKRKEL